MKTRAENEKKFSEKGLKNIQEIRKPVFGLILIGDELLSGRRTDKHLPKVIELLAQRGQSLSWMHCIGDDPARITQELKWAFATGDIVFSCGGIGATPDDYTRQCTAAALGVPLEMHPEAKALILERTRDVAQDKTKAIDESSSEVQQRLNMGVFPEGSRIIPNPYNKIPGFSVHDVHFMPGFPVMAWPMMEWVLDQVYKGRLQPVAHAERSILVYGIGEASLTPLMEAMEQMYPGLKIFSLPSVDHPVHGAHIELGVKGEPGLVNRAFETMVSKLGTLPVRLGPELVQKR